MTALLSFSPCEELPSRLRVVLVLKESLLSSLFMLVLLGIELWVYSSVSFCKVLKPLLPLGLLFLSEISFHS